VTTIATDARGELGQVLEDLGPDEQRTIAFLARRLLLGQRQYGRLDLEHDARDFATERAEEIGDLLVYSAFAALRATVARPPHVVRLDIAADEDGHAVSLDGGPATWRRSRPHAVLAALSDALPSLVGTLLEGREVVVRVSP